MLDIIGEDIKSLNDTNLRILVDKLCQATLTQSGLSIAGVTAGGHQNAADGGTDVRVDVNASLDEDGFIPRSKTVYQVKVEDMPKSKISKEMKPNRQLRPFFTD